MKMALITPSYKPDLERCCLLSRTIDRWVDDSIDHVVIVPKRDIKAFERLPARSRVITVESILPKGVWQIPQCNKWWLTSCSIPVRGWIMQQIVKLSAAAYLDYDVVVFIDSDIVIIRPISPDLFIRGGKVRLYKLPESGNSVMHMRWHRVAAKKLGLKVKDYFGADYIGPMISWYKPNVEQMLSRIEDVCGKHWFSELANTIYFAEYLLYGIYVDFIAKESANHFSESEQLCHCHWGFKFDKITDISPYLDAVDDKHVAVLVQSNKNFDVDSYHQILKSKKLID